MRALLTLATLVSLAGHEHASPCDPAPIIAPARASDDSTARRLVELLRTGGYVLVFRHAHTDRTHGDLDTALTNRAAQRNLSDEGVEQARVIGRSARALGVPVGEVLAGPMFRTRETAEHAFGRADTTELLRLRADAPEARALLTTPPPAGTNRVLVTHNASIDRWFTPLGQGRIEEGDAVVVRPLGAEGFTLVGRLRVAEWGRLAATVK